MSETIKVSPLKKISGEIAVPGDKSISHRAAILAGLSDGSCFVENFLPSEDCVNTLRAMAQLGVRYEVKKGTEDQPVDLLIHGCHGELQAPKAELDCGNSGTGMRLLAGVLAAQKFDSVLIGDDSLSSRPMGRIIKPLAEMGAQFETKGEKPGCAPLHITGGTLKPITYEMPMASAQVKSAILLASFGVTVRTDENKISVYGGQKVRSRDLVIPGDISSAAFWIVAAACMPGARLRMTNVGLNPTRTALLNVLIRMGAVIKDHVQDDGGGEPRGSIEIIGSQLEGTQIKKEEVPNLIDEVPILAVAGAMAEGTTTIRNAAELRVKETDRIETTATNLRAMGADITEHEDGMTIHGGPVLHGATVDSYGDHRIAMAFAIAGLLAKKGSTVIENTECVATSYPTFTDHLEEICKR